MNKVCLVLSLGLLMTNGQQILGKTPIALEKAQQAHKKAELEYRDAVAARDTARREGYYIPNSSVPATRELAKDLDDNVTKAKCSYDKTQYNLELAQKHAHAQEILSHYDAPPSYAQAIGQDTVDDLEMAREAQHQEKDMRQARVLIIDTFARIHRIDPQQSRQLAKELNQKYNPSNGWFGF